MTHRCTFQNCGIVNPALLHLWSKANIGFFTVRINRHGLEYYSVHCFSLN